MPRLLRLCLLASLALAPSHCRAENAAPADPPYYHRKPTWRETMLASRPALQEYLAKSGAGAFQPYVSAVIHGKQEPEHIQVDVTGVRELWLIAEIGPDTYNFDQATWGKPTLTDKDGKQTPVSSLKPKSAKVGWGELTVDKDNWGTPLQVADRKFKHGFWAHAPSALCFQLDGKYTKFEAWVGVGVQAGENGTVQFSVLDRPDGTATTEALWRLLEREFTSDQARQERKWERQDRVWEDSFKPGDFATLAARYAKATRNLRSLPAEAARLAQDAADAQALAKVQALYRESRGIEEAVAEAQQRLAQVNFPALRLAIEELTAAFPDQYRGGSGYLKRSAEYEKQLPGILKALPTGEEQALKQAQEVVAFQQRALLSNPLLNFDRLLLVKRTSRQLGLPQNWQGNCALPKTGYDNTLEVLSPVSPQGTLTTLFRPEGDRFVGDIDLSFDAKKMLLSMPGSHNRWQVWELGADGTGLHELPLGDHADVENYDACYLPDGRILFGSTRYFQGVPCVNGSNQVANLFQYDPGAGGIRQLCFEQDHDWCPTVLPNGRVLYARWEYSDLPHSNSRMLFDMNPDGTDQKAFYGSNSFWPNGVFYARPIPGSSTEVVGIVSGHHGVPRMGELVLFDHSKGREEATGVVQRIPGYGKRVEPLIRDQLVDASWPKFLHPYPLSDKYFLVSAQPSSTSAWGLYLVDVFDNLLLLKEAPGYALFEPLPLRPTSPPPVVPDRVNLARKDAVVYLSDVYAGKGLAGIPRGTVKSLRVLSYHFSYQQVGGLLGTVGMDGPWDIKRILGTVPVAPDGSATFRVPANTPVSVQPLDADGEALQLMRSWFTAMPGEKLSCVGCHEQQSDSPPVQQNVAASQAPVEIQPWYGPARGFAFAREVQPVLDKYCVSCHNGQPRAEGAPLFDLRGTAQLTDWTSVTPGHAGGSGGHFSVAYANLHAYVRRPGIESDIHLLSPMDFHADTTELVQMLRKGHGGVHLDPESGDRLFTWIDLNAPYHGTWTEIAGEQAVKPVADRRREMVKVYANLDEDPEAVPAMEVRLAGGGSMGAMNPIGPIAPTAAPPTVAAAHPVALAPRRLPSRSLDLGHGLSLDLVQVPAGEFVMGSDSGLPDEQPATRVQIAKPFWSGKFEVTNEQYALFDPTHDSHFESKHAYQFGVHGFPLNEPKQPVVRVSWQQAMAFCQWLSKQTGLKVSLPTEAQWEYACRAGTDTPFSFGAAEADFSKCANLSDAKMTEFAEDPYQVFAPLANPPKYDDWIPKDARFNDGQLVAADVGKYQPNAWGVHDMHGNVWEWTRSPYAPYPYRAAAAAPGTDEVVRGGSWYDRPYRATSSYRLAYQPYQRVFNVGFRVVCEAGAAPRLVAKTAEVGSPAR